MTTEIRKTPHEALADKEGHDRQESLIEALRFELETGVYDCAPYTAQQKLALANLIKAWGSKDHRAYQAARMPSAQVLLGGAKPDDIRAEFEDDFFFWLCVATRRAFSRETVSFMGELPRLRRRKAAA